ncbi:putative ABC transport system ATP-binding protein [Pseudomonas sp. SJZ079]|uniref:ABC transporter ATP-binding protein n=1 Tax=Pseudomonas sp. SJZ079 TaxID=2572887 RepID=UPI001199B972|nr:ABC transporter ATP-binding protein [Pseudomonas sp. SJZ079]TWC39566.1 putative ABC transport system ATP-binding protein [Pseudomonas sp. SJZ079]
MPTNGNSCQIRSNGAEVRPLEAFELYRFFHRGDDETAALRGVSLRLLAGEFVALMGPSGSGKSTLLACLAGLDEPDGGHVEVMGQRMSRRSEAARAALRARHIGMLMQTGNLFDHLTVEANIKLQMSLSGQSNRQSIEQLLAVIGLTRQRQAYPSQLSGGEAARAGLALALSSNPQVLLADEPTAEVDATTEATILNHLMERCRAGVAVLVATHSEVIATHADRRISIQDGRITYV